MEGGKSWGEVAEAEAQADALADKLQSSVKIEDGAEPTTTKRSEGLLPESEDNTKITVHTSDSKPLAPIYAAVSKFEELNLKQELLQGVYGMGFSRPSKIQEVSLPLILNDPPQNLVAQAQSGTGKTAAFSLGMLSRVDATQNYPQAVCVCHTRELARQNFAVVSALGKFTTIKPILVVPEENVPQRITSQIVIGTPGKLTDCVKRRALDLSKVRVFVLDEADVMIDTQGLSAQTIRLKQALPGGGRQCQMLLFSATYSESVAKFSSQVVPDPHVSIRLERKDESLDAIAQFYIQCRSEQEKFSQLCALYIYLTIGQSVIFVNRRDTGAELARKMQGEGHKVSLLSGEMQPNERDSVLDDFRQGRTKVLITTNVMARGIDIMAITLVINYDLPMEHGRPDTSTYLHRIGRSGRFGRNGIAINFVHDDATRRVVGDIERHFQRPIHQLTEEQIPELDKMLRELN